MRDWGTAATSRNRAAGAHRKLGRVHEGTSDLADQGTDSPCGRRFDAPAEAGLGIGAADSSGNAFGTRVVQLRRAFQQ